MGETFRELLLLLGAVRDYLDTNRADVMWSHFGSIDAALEVVDSYIDRAYLCDTSVIPELKLFFAPTGDAQEIAIQSGWGAEFLEIASRFDQLAEPRGRSRPPGKEGLP